MRLNDRASMLFPMTPGIDFHPETETTVLTALNSPDEFRTVKIRKVGVHVDDCSFATRELRPA